MHSPNPARTWQCSVFDFTTTREVLGKSEEIDFVKVGAVMKVNNENLPEYLKACLNNLLLCLSLLVRESREMKRLC